MMINPNVISIIDVGGITHSGRVFAPKQLQKKDGLENTRNKEVSNSNIETRPSRKALPRVEAGEFLRIIKKSDCKVVDQLGQTPSKISMISLLLSSEAHREYLLKVMNEAHVTKDITVDQFYWVVANITTSNCLGFSSEKMPPKGHAHNKALHISVK